MVHKPLAYLQPVEASESRSVPLRLCILGATGSIGMQTVELVESHPDRFAVTAISTNRRLERALEICRRVKPGYLVVCDEAAGKEALDLIARYSPSTRVLVGSRHMATVATLENVDMVVTATVGYSGFIPTIAAIKSGKDIALANKETLVVGGEIIRELMQHSGSRIFPVDSEHSAIAQCLMGEDLSKISQLLITASGGPFRTLNPERLSEVTASDALKHPNWNMGAKITIDSATMMNKAFEIIEAHYLFGIEASAIRAIVHPQSIVHSMVLFADGSVKAQMGVPDMHLPIAFALGMNNRIEGAERPPAIADMSTLTFEAPDEEKFPCLRLAATALEKKGNIPCIINAANEVAVEFFLDGRLRFTEIYPLICKTIDAIPFIAEPTVAEIMETDGQSRSKARQIAINL